MRTKELFSIGFSLGLISSLVSCQTGPVDSSVSPVSSSVTSENSVFSEGRVVKVYRKAPANPMVRGVCFISSQQKNFFDTPCKNIELILSSEDDKETLTDQTDDEGRFYFQVKKATPYELKIESDKYKTASEVIKVSAGSDVLIRLVRK